MDILGNNTALDTILTEKCRTFVGTNVTTIASYMLGFFVSVFLSNALHALLRPLSQPRIISEFIVGLFVSNLPIVRSRILDGYDGLKTLGHITDFGMIFHMFVLGLEIDPYILFQPSLREIKVASTGMVSTFILVLLVIPYLKIFENSNTKLNYSLCIVLSGTASPLLTRIITDLKIGKSDIGRFVVSVGIQSDLLSILLLSLGPIVFDPIESYELRSSAEILTIISTLVIQTVIAAKLTPLLMNWVNNENPEGKPMKVSHFIIHTAYVVLVCSISVNAGFNMMFSVFIAGLFMPSEGRVAKMMITKINYLLSSILYPLFFLWVGAEGGLKQFNANHLLPWAMLFVFFATATVGKVVGTMVSGLMLGFRWPELVATGLLLNTKGHYHVYLAIVAAKHKSTNISTSMAMIFATFLTIICTPLVVASIIKRARKRSPTQRVALQWLDPSSKLRILLGLHGPQNVPSAINFMEISRGPSHPGLMVYATDMIELTDRIAATLTQGEGIDTLTVKDQGVLDMRDQITNGVQAYLNEEIEGISLRQMLCLATINSMPQDICILAEDLLVSLIILPFHKEQQADGRLSLGHSGFRHVNRKVLRHAPCSVGILVDRGLGSISIISRSSASLNAAIIFIGGKDDREALAFAGRVAQHPGVKLTVIRFILESNSDSVSTRTGRARFNTAEQQEEMKLDDEYFAEFYDRRVARGRVAYMEKYLVNSGQTFSTLQSLEGQYGLFIVGRGGRVNSVLTAGMNDWEECPELGPIGDILSTSEFSVTASVLIIQQHSIRGELDGLDDEFSIMKM